MSGAITTLKNDPLANGLMFADERLRLAKGEMTEKEAIKIICRIGQYLAGKRRLEVDRGR